MNIKFTNKVPVQEVELEENVVVGGEVVGWIKKKRETERYGSRYHSGFDLGGGSRMLIQGHGDTKEEAIIQAIKGGKDDAARLLAAISELENKLGGITV